MASADRWFPGLPQFRAYERSWLTQDVVAGLALTGLLAPAGMAYAAAAGLPPVNGLYASILPLVAYAVFGPSRIMVVGPDSALTPLIAAAVLPFMRVSPAEGLAAAGMLAIVAGLACLVAGLLRFGFVAELLSAPVRYGYLHGIALTIIVGQSAKLCGFSVPGESLTGQVRDLVRGLRGGEFRGWSFAIGVVCLALIVVLRAVNRRIPGTLIVVIAGILAGVAFGVERHGVGVVGNLPRGIPSPAWPHLHWSQISTLIGAGLGLALVAFADTSVLSRAMSIRRREQVDDSKELIALGVGNIAAGLFHGFPISSSSSRTPVAEAAGARTQLTGVVAAAGMMGVALAVPTVFRHMPEATLAAIVCAAAISLIDIPALVRLFGVRRSEFTLAIAATVAVALLGPVTGAGVAVGLSILNFVRLEWQPYTAELVRVDGLKGYHDRARHPEGHTIPGLLLYRFDAPLFFANSHHFAEDLRRRIAAQDRRVRCVIVTAEPITDVDATAAEMLGELVDELRAAQVDLRFAELKGTVHDRVDRYQVFGQQMPDHTARTTGQAVKAYLTEFDVPWVDWEDHTQ